MDKERVLTLSQVSQHKPKQDCWLVINGGVLNVTKFIEEHPGGKSCLNPLERMLQRNLRSLGIVKQQRNCSVHSRWGISKVNNIVKEENDAAAQKEESKAAKEIKAIVIKGDPTPKHTALVEIFVPLLVAFFYFAYSNFTGAINFHSWIYVVIYSES